MNFGPGNLKLDALVAKIRAEVEIRKRRDGSVAVETNKTRAARAKREGLDDPSLTALMRASNGVVFTAKPDPYKHFHEVGRLSVLQKQICRCCEHEQINVVCEMVHLRGKTAPDTPKADVWVRRSSTNTTLPHEQPMWAPSYGVEFCADCVLVGAQTSCWEAEAASIPDASGQLALIN